MLGKGGDMSKYKLTKEDKLKIKNLQKEITKLGDQISELDDKMDEHEHQIDVIKSGGLLGKKVYIEGVITQVRENFQGEEIFVVRYNRHEEEYDEDECENYIDDDMYTEFLPNQVHFKDIVNSKIGKLL